LNQERAREECPRGEVVEARVGVLEWQRGREESKVWLERKLREAWLGVKQAELVLLR